MDYQLAATHTYFSFQDGDLLHNIARYPVESMANIFICILICNTYFKQRIIFKIEYFISLHWFKNF
jgi:hypothetical protein